MAKIRTEIVSYINENQTATAAGLAKTFNVTVANIRYHLKHLIQDGVIELMNNQNLSPRGRPTQIYSLSRKEKSTGLEFLLRSSLEDISSIKSDRARKNRLVKLAKIIASSPKHPSRSMTIKLGEAINRLNELNFNARWEAHSNSPNILFQNCPYSSLVDSFPILCQLDQYLLEDLLGTSVIQEEKLSTNRNAHPICRFTTD